jgi:hypothetical protein
MENALDGADIDMLLLCRSLLLSPPNDSLQDIAGRWDGSGAHLL